ncbi:MAG TPA: universal stress protein [Nitrososphaeraceae archaeon]|jgi:nucleotide-binding universal stress UspA family protein
MKSEQDLGRLSKIVAAVDLSIHSKFVMEKASILSAAFNSDLYIVSVVKMPKLAAEENEILMSEIKEEENELIRHHKMLIEKYFMSTNLLVESKVLHGDPASKICDFAESVSADLIIIANTGKSGIKRVFLGSTSEAVSHNAPCSVMIVKRRKTI